MKYSFLKTSYDRLLYSVMKHMEQGDSYYFSFTGKSPIVVDDYRIGAININQEQKGKVPALLEVYDYYGYEIPVTSMEFWDKLEEELINNNIEL